MKLVIAIPVTLAGMIAAYWLGQRMSDEMVLLLIGMGCGMSSMFVFGAFWFVRAIRSLNSAAAGWMEPEIKIVPPRAGLLEDVTADNQCYRR